MNRSLLRLVCLILALLLGPLATRSQQPPLAPETPAAPETAEPKKSSERQFVRVRRDADGEPLAMETAVVRYVPRQDAADVHVDLVGAVHVGEKSYYQQLNELFQKYDVVLYELVAPEGTRVPRGGRPAGDAHPLSAMQSGMQSILELEHQLDRVDYTKENFVHADMSPEEFSKSMKDRGESFVQMFFRMLGQGMAEQARDPQRSTDRQLLSAFFAKDRPMRLKRIMAEQFENLEGQTAVFDGPDGSTIITERNRKAFEVLRKELDAGKKRIAVFYGAGHLPDMEDRLLRDFDMRRERVQWLEAWGLAAP